MQRLANGIVRTANENEERYEIKADTDLLSWYTVSNGTTGWPLLWILWYLYHNLANKAKKGYQNMAKPLTQHGN